MSESDMRDRNETPDVAGAHPGFTLLRRRSSSPLFDDDARWLLYLQFSNSRVIGQQAFEGRAVTDRITRPSHDDGDKLPALLSAEIVCLRENVALCFKNSARNRCEPFGDRVSVRPRRQYARAGGATDKGGAHRNPPNSHFPIFPQPVRKT